MGNALFLIGVFILKQRKTLDASIIICNHHLLFVDSHSRYEEEIDYSDDAILPSFRHLIVDEAHNMERHATDLFTDSFSSYSLLRQISYIYDHKATKGSGYGRMLNDLLQFSTKNSLYEEIISLYDTLRIQTETLNMMMLGILDVNKMAHLLLTEANAKFVIKEILSIAEIVIEKGNEFVSKLCNFVTSIKAMTKLSVQNVMM